MAIKPGHDGSTAAASNPAMHRLLCEFAACTGLGVLCNPSLDQLRRGFINRTSDLAAHCEHWGVDDVVVGDRWYAARTPGVRDGAH
jgi:hydroxymethyl cephem carbamoyltransferase